MRRRGIRCIQNRHLPAAFCSSHGPYSLIPVAGPPRTALPAGVPATGVPLVSTAGASLLYDEFDWMLAPAACGPADERYIFDLVQRCAGCPGGCTHQPSA